MCQLCNIRIQYFMSSNTCNPTLRVDSSVFRSGRCWSSNGIVNVLCKLSDKNQRHSSKTFFVFELCHINILEPEMQTAKQLRKQTKLNVIMWVMREWAVRWALACKFYQTAKGWRRLDDSCNIQVFTQIILIIMIIAKSSTRAFFFCAFHFFSVRSTAVMRYVVYFMSLWWLSKPHCAYVCKVRSTNHPSTWIHSTPTIEPYRWYLSVLKVRNKQLDTKRRAKRCFINGIMYATALSISLLRLCCLVAAVATATQNTQCYTMYPNNNAIIHETRIAKNYVKWH